MLDSILDSFAAHTSFTHVEALLERDRMLDVHGLGGSSGAFFTAYLRKHRLDGDGGRSVLAICAEDEEASALRDDIEAILGADHVRFFPERDVHSYEQADSHFEVRSQRVETLDTLEQGWKGVVVATAVAVHDPTTPPGFIDLISIDVAKGDSIEFDYFVRSLIAKGFKRCSAVVSAGQVSVRGGIVDIFPFGSDMPYRVEFWGDEIESIRTFSTSTQRSLETVNRFRIIPPDEFVSEAGLDIDDERRIRNIEHDTGIDLSFLREAFGGGDRRDGIEQYLFTTFGDKASLVSYFSPDDVAVVFSPDRCLGVLKKRLEQASVYRERFLAEEPYLPPPEYFYQSPDMLLRSLERLSVVNNHELKPHGDAVVEFSVSPSRQYQGHLEELKRDIENARAEGLSCHILCDNMGQLERLNELLEEIEGDYGIDVAHLSSGFYDPVSGVAVYTDHEIFSRYRRRTRYRRYRDGVPIPDHRALTLGDYVVHIDYGIGRYMGLKRSEIGGSETDCLVVEYRNRDELLLPVSKLDKLKKFSAEEGVVPVVSKLGGTSWEKLKAKTKKSIQRIAGDLLRLYAERKTVPGFAFKPDEHMLRSMEETFVFEETPDQLTAWDEVRNDMLKDVPMERLICGDVGFGKTEIAMRAAFLCVLNSKQIVVLVPTTILAEQHEKTFRERFADFPVTIESLSRFRSPSEQKKILERLSRGEVDIIIGTHRLFSRDVHVKNPGLLIIDEEQRFGVRHKERLKKLRSNVDVLTMSATPIPRTLNMSLLGARDISYINTPPRDRYSVHTEILPFEEKTLIEAILREVDRDGQVYFVHNRVQSIESMAGYLRRLLPNVSFGVAHGQLPEKHLERVMHEFNVGKYQVLVTTMIIENGLDIPSVNTIIVNRADTFGLAQLYQLRGRVGRSNRRAFAYLMIPPKVTLTKTARRRLKTIEEFVGLGSGFNIAMRDLEIRGAGNILGTDQSGFISAIGFDLYMDLLRETIAGFKGKIIEKPPDVDIHIEQDAFLPEEYVPDATDRIIFYRRLSETISPDDVIAVEDELTDRFGRMPEPVRNLVDSSYIRHFASRIDASDVWIHDGYATVFVPEGVDTTRQAVEKMVTKSPVRLRFSFHNGMKIDFDYPTDDDGILGSVKNILQVICT